MKRHPFELIIKMSKSAFTIAENRKIGIFRTQSIPQPKFKIAGFIRFWEENIKQEILWGFF